MSWVRILAKRIFGPYLPYMPPDKASKYIAVCRIAYFFSATSLLFVFLKWEDEEKQKALETGKPVLEDHSEGHRLMRVRGYDSGIFYDYTPGKGMTSFEVNREEYYQQLEKEAFERSKKAQEKAIAEGRELPSDAIKLV